MAKDVLVDVRYTQRLARRLLDPAVTPDGSELGMAAVPALSADLLPDWYDDWLLLEAEDWRRLRLHGLEALAGRLIALGRRGEAASAAGAAVRTEPLREMARAALIQVHLAAGNQSEAAREFICFRTLLHAELAWRPRPGCTSSCRVCRSATPRPWPPRRILDASRWDRAPVTPEGEDKSSGLSGVDSNDR